MTARCCARCKTPYMCGFTDCGCHVNRGATCGSCGTPLFVPPPKPQPLLVINFMNEIERAA